MPGIASPIAGIVAEPGRSFERVARGLGRALVASLVLAGSAMFSTPAAAQYVPGGECWDDIVELCEANYQSWGYRNASECANHEWCYYCAGGYLCGFDPRWPYYNGSTKPGAETPW
jgi:hypothetical protein